MRGRKPKPTKLKQLNGNPGKRPLNRREPRATGTPVCPVHLDDVAREEWERVAPLLLEMGVLASVDQAALAAYCQAYSTWADAQRQIAARGTVVVNAAGNKVPSPHVRISAIAVDQMRKFMAEFGMTPSSRSRLTGGGADNSEENPFASIAAENRAIQ